MKIRLLALSVLLLLLPGCLTAGERERVPTPDRGNNSKSRPRVDGVYFQVSDDRTYTQYLRFFEDGTVIFASVQVDASTAGLPPAMLKWFNAKHEDQGKYTVLGNEIKFTSTSSVGSVDYSGVIGDDHLVLDVHSRINGYRVKAQRYDFLPIKTE